LVKKRTDIREQESYDSSEDDIAGTLLLHVDVFPEGPNGKASVAIEALG
jgi:hypothetical protein